MTNKKDEKKKVYTIKNSKKSIKKNNKKPVKKSGI
jgi:hypothetical protein